MLKNKAAFGRYFCAALFAAGLCLAMAAAGQAAQKTQPAGVRFTIRPYQERQLGAPGYQAKMDFIETRSALYPHAEEIGQYINAQLLESLFSTRMESEEADLAEFCAETKRKGSACANEMLMRLQSKAVIGRMASIRYDYSFFPLGAAHPMHGTSSYNFSLKPLFRLESLSALFIDEVDALPLLQSQIRAALLAKRDEDGQMLLDKDTVLGGTKEWKDFDTFTLSKTGITVIFSPYAVAAYAFGTQEAELPYAGLKAQIKPFYRKALGLE